MAQHNHTEEDGQMLESQVVTLTLDDDEEVDCAILVTFDVANQEYIALSPMDENGENVDGDVWLYRFLRDTTGEGKHDLENIEDDEEYEMVADKFDEWLDTQAFEEMEDTF